MKGFRLVPKRGLRGLVHAVNSLRDFHCAGWATVNSISLQEMEM